MTKSEAVISVTSAYKGICAKAFLRHRMGKEWTAKSIEANKSDTNSTTSTNSNNSSGSGKFQRNVERPIVLRKRRERVKSAGNWHLFYFMFTQDHAKPNLIWNYKVSSALALGFFRQFEESSNLNHTCHSL